MVKKTPNIGLDERKLVLEERRLALEEQKAATDDYIRREELNIKARESGWASRFFSPLTTTLLAGILTLAGSVAATLLQGRQTLQLETQKFEASRKLEKDKFDFSSAAETQKQQHELVVKMISVPNIDQAKQNLTFLAESQLIAKEEADKLLAALKKSSPLIPPVGSSADAVLDPSATIFDSPYDSSASASCITTVGMKYIARYYRSAEATVVRSLSAAEARSLSALGVKLVALFEENESRTVSGFSKASGERVANWVFSYARGAVGQPPGTAIFFAVDFDASDRQINDRVIPFFAALSEANRSVTNPEHRYRIGVYGSGAVINRLQSAGLVEFRWLSSALRWNGSEAARDKNAWDIRQVGHDVSRCNAVFGASILRPNLVDTSFAFSVLGSSVAQ